VSERAVDLELVRRVQAGDRAAFDLLVRKYQHRIAHLVSRYVRDQAEAEDVAQEAFIKAYRGLANFRGESAFYTWLYRIAVNTAKNWLVASGRRVPDQGVDAVDAEQYESGALLRDGATPEREMLSREIEAEIHRTIEALPRELREAITLREMEGLSYEEIATVMDCPVGTVRSRIFRAREAVDRRLAPLLDETGAYDDGGGEARR
jgi:RNA polymerase sigma-70 factor, ECF subfamily